MTETVEVKVGQVWADCDWRAAKRGREVKVVELGTVQNGMARYALVVTRFAGGEWGTKQTRVRLDRFRPTSTGYKLSE